MSQDPVPHPGQSSEYTEQQVIEAIAMQRCPGRAVKEIQLGFYTDTHHTNYVWIVLLEPTGDPSRPGTNGGGVPGSAWDTTTSLSATGAEGPPCPASTAATP
jgi:hypothetical protein